MTSVSRFIHKCGFSLRLTFQIAYNLVERERERQREFHNVHCVISSHLHTSQIITKPNPMYLLNPNPNTHTFITLYLVSIFPPSTNRNSTEIHHYEHNTVQVPYQPNERIHKNVMDCRHQFELPQSRK